MKKTTIVINHDSKEGMLHALSDITQNVSRGYLKSSGVVTQNRAPLPVPAPCPPGYSRPPYETDCEPVAPETVDFEHVTEDA